jgi:hypothetical protein
LQDDFARSNEKLDFPVLWLVERRRNNKNLRIWNGLRPLAAFLSQSNLYVVNKVGCSSQSEDGVGKMKRKVCRLRELTAPAELEVSLLRCGVVFDAWAREVCS